MWILPGEDVPIHPPPDFRTFSRSWACEIGSNYWFQWTSWSRGKKLGQSEYFDWNSESESYFLWTYSQGRQTPHQHCLQFTPRICRHLEEFRQVFKNSVHTFLILRGNIHVCWSLFWDLPLSWALEGGRVDWLAILSTPPLISKFLHFHAQPWELLMSRLRGHLRTSSVFRFACHVTFGPMCFKKNIVKFQPPLSPLLQNMFRKNLYNWKLYKIHLKKLPKTPEVWHGIPKFAMLGKEMHPFHAHKIYIIL